MLKKFFIFCILGVIFSFGVLKGASLLPTSFMHLVHLIVTPKDLYNPIVYDEFLFYNKGHAKTYSLETKYNDYYEIGIIFEKKDMPSGYATKSKYIFNGKLKIDFFSKDLLVSSNIISSYESVIYSKNDMNYLEKISLSIFEVPLMGKYKKNVSVRVSVLEPDIVLKNYADSAKLYIGISTPSGEGSAATNCGGSSSGGSSSGGSSSGGSSSGGSSSGGSSSGATITIQENTTGFCGVDGSVDNNNSGYTGDGFANTDNASGNYVEFAINSNGSGSVSLEIRYANGSDSNRPADIVVPSQHIM